MAAKLLIINGTSCAGKSSAATYIADNTPYNFAHVSWDSFLDMLPADETISDDQNKDLVQRFLDHTCDRLSHGENLILDVVCIPTDTWQRLQTSYAPYTPFTVLLSSSPTQLRAREEKREDRKNGQAEAQHQALFEQEDHPPYDIHIDTGLCSVTETGQMIISSFQQKLLAQHQHITNAPFKGPVP